MNTRYGYGIVIALIISLAGIGGCDRKDTPTQFDFVTVGTPNNFLKYPNPYPSLPAGRYTLVAATSAAGVSGNFVLRITYDDGSMQTFTGNWTGSGGQDPSSIENKRFTFNMDKAGGISVSLQSTVDNYLYLLDRSDTILFENNNASATNLNALISLPKSKIDNAAWTAAYYAAIDPLNERDTLSKWKAKNGFGAGEDIHIIFRDTKDLGYGRDMHARRNNNGCMAVFVRNFAVNLIDGLPYNTLNLTAAVANDSKHHFGTNAIEFSDLDGDCDGIDPMFAKFYTFKAYPENPTADETRLDKVDLDHRGDKAMPGPCIVCHGGSAYPLLSDGTFPSAALPGASNPELRVGDVNARMQPLEVDTFEFSDVAGYSRAEQEAKLHQLNKMVYETFPQVAQPAGEWTGDFIKEVSNGWYSGDITDNDNSTFAPFIPTGWTYDANDNDPPLAAESLFLNVVKPYCFSCHSKRGSDLGTDANASSNGQDIDFSTYTKFISYADKIDDYVYVRGLMPLSRLTYDKFWESDAPEILATHIPGFSHGNADGSINQPGAPIANPGLDRTSNAPVTLSAASSLFADSYTWSLLTQPSGSTATLSPTNSIRPLFTADMDGVYTIQLIAHQGNESSAPAILTLTVNNTLLPLTEDITFADIKLILQNTTSPTPVTASSCMACHVSGGTGVPGVPVFYSDSPTLYQDILKRVNFDKPELSPLLLKPSGSHHFGGMRAGFGVAGDLSSYDLFLNWILQGAREN